MTAHLKSYSLLPAIQNVYMEMKRKGNNCNDELGMIGFQLKRKTKRDVDSLMWKSYDPHMLTGLSAL